MASRSLRCHIRLRWIVGQSGRDMLSLLCAHNWIKNGKQFGWWGGKVKVTRSYDITDQPAVSHHVNWPESLLPLCPIQQHSLCMPPMSSSFQIVHFFLYSPSLCLASKFSFSLLFSPSPSLFLPSSLPLSLALSLSGWTGTEPTNTAIKRTPVWVWKRYQGLATLTLPLHTLT